MKITHKTILPMKTLRTYLIFSVCLLIGSCTTTNEEPAFQEQDAIAYDPVNDPLIAEFYAINEKYERESSAAYDTPDTRSVFSFIKKIFKTVGQDCVGLYQGFKKGYNKRGIDYAIDLSTDYGSRYSFDAWHGVNTKETLREFHTRSVYAHYVVRNDPQIETKAQYEDAKVNLQLSSTQDKYRYIGQLHNLTVNVLETTPSFNESFLADISDI